jgi:hypothetical protein
MIYFEEEQYKELKDITNIDNCKIISDQEFKKANEILKNIKTINNLKQILALIENKYKINKSKNENYVDNNIISLMLTINNLISEEKKISEDALERILENDVKNILINVEDALINITNIDYLNKILENININKNINKDISNDVKQIILLQIKIKILELINKLV